MIVAGGYTFPSLSNADFDAFFLIDLTIGGETISSAY